MMDLIKRFLGVFTDLLPARTSSPIEPTATVAHGRRTAASPSKHKRKYNFHSPDSRKNKRSKIYPQSAQSSKEMVLFSDNVGKEMHTESYGSDMDIDMDIDDAHDEKLCALQLGQLGDFDGDEPSDEATNPKLNHAVSHFHLDEDSFMDLADQLLSDDEQVDDTTLTFSEASNEEVVTYRKVAAIPTDGATPAFSPEDLRAAGWEESHIKLVGLLENRGREAILPYTWQQGLRFIPSNLFADHDEPVVKSYLSPIFHSEVAFRRLLDLGGYVRSSLSTTSHGNTPERQTKKFLKDYMKWAIRDSGLDETRALPVVKIVTATSETDDKTLVARATRALQRLSDKYREELQAQQSTEITPHSSFGTETFHNMPTLYALVASHTIVALAALKPNDTILQSIAFFDFATPDLDFWSSLALAIILCHARDVQMEIAKAGLGVKLATETGQGVKLVKQTGEE